MGVFGSVVVLFSIVSLAFGWFARICTRGHFTLTSKDKTSRNRHRIANFPAAALKVSVLATMATLDNSLARR